MAAAMLVGGASVVMFVVMVSATIRLVTLANVPVSPRAARPQLLPELCPTQRPLPPGYKTVFTS